MAAAVPIIAVIAGGVASAAVGGGLIGAIVATGVAYIVTQVGKSVFPTKTAASTRAAAAAANSLTATAATRTQSFRQAITEHQIVLGRVKVGGPIVFLHSATDDAGREDGFFYEVVVLAAHHVAAIGEVWLGDKLESDASFAGLVRIDRHLGEPDQAADANLIAETGGKWTAAHRGQGRAYISVRLKITAETFPSGPPNIAALVTGADSIYDPRSGATGWSDNAALCLAWYITASFGWRAAWADIDIPSLIAAANVCDEIVGTRAGIAERRYTCNGTLSLAEGKIAITEKLVAAMAGALVVSGGRFFIHAGAPALPAATLTSNDLRGDITIMGSRARRDLFNGVRATYVEPNASWQATDAPPLLASNYVTEDGGEVIYTDLEFPLTTSVSTVQRLMKIALERNRRQRTVAFPANFSALRLRPWEGATVALDRLVPFPARVTGWSLAADGGVDLTLSEEDSAVWAWDPAVDERATGDSPSVVLPNPGRISAPASISVATPQGTAFTFLAVSWSAVGSVYLDGYEVEIFPVSGTVWQGYAAGLRAITAYIPAAEPTAVRVRAVARSGAVSGWTDASLPTPVAALAATAITGGVRLSGTFPAYGEKVYQGLQVVRQSQSDWSDEADIGIVARNLDSSVVDLRLVSGFTIGLRTLGDGRGFEDTTLILGRFLNNRIGLDIHCATATAWNTSVRYYGGHFAIATGVNAASDRFGVRLSKAAGAYNNHNRHVFDAPNFELKQLDPNVAIPFLNETSGTAIIARAIRMESCSPIVARHTGGATDCEYEIAWCNTYAVRMDYTAAATRAGNAVFNRHRAPTSRLTRLLAAIPNLRAAAFRHSATEIGVEGAVVIATSTTTQTYIAGLCWNGLDGITATGVGLTLNANRGIALPFSQISLSNRSHCIAPQCGQGTK